MGHTIRRFKGKRLTESALRKSLAEHIADRLTKSRYNKAKATGVYSTLDIINLITSRK